VWSVTDREWRWKYPHSRRNWYTAVAPKCHSMQISRILRGVYYGYWFHSVYLVSSSFLLLLMAIVSAGNAAMKRHRVLNWINDVVVHFKFQMPGVEDSTMVKLIIFNWFIWYKCWDWFLLITFSISALLYPNGSRHHSRVEINLELTWHSSGRCWHL
jgi:hypothetical protein